MRADRRTFTSATTNLPLVFSAQAQGAWPTKPVRFVEAETKK